MKLGLLLDAYRRLHALSAAQLAAEIGIGPRALRRLERGASVDAESFAKVLTWILTNPAPALFVPAAPLTGGRDGESD